MNAPTPVAALAERATADPDLVAFRVLESGTWCEYSWSDVEWTVARTADLLARHQVRSGTLLGLACGSRPEWPLCVWAAHALGASVLCVEAHPDTTRARPDSHVAPAAWIVESASSRDTIAEWYEDPTVCLVIDDRIAADDAGGTWANDVLGGSVTQDPDKLAAFRDAVMSVDQAAVALITSEGALTHTELLAHAEPDGNDRYRLQRGDELLALVPPHWRIEAISLIAGMPLAGATVNFGSPSGGGIAELAMVAPTVLVAPFMWWDWLAGRLAGAREDAGRIAKAVLGGLEGGNGRSPAAALARRTLLRRLGLMRLRDARSLGKVQPSTETVLGALGVPFGAPLEVPVGLCEPSTSHGQDQSRAPAAIGEGS